MNGVVEKPIEGALAEVGDYVIVFVDERKSFPRVVFDAQDEQSAVDFFIGFVHKDRRLMEAGWRCEFSLVRVSAIEGETAVLEPVCCGCECWPELRDAVVSKGRLN